MIFVLPVFAAFSYLLFKDTLNKLQAVGPVYWITRDIVPKKTPIVTIGFMHEIDFPWRKGKGIQIRIPRRTFQLGVCHKGTDLDETTGTLSAVGGRFMDTPPTEIGEW